MKKIDLEKTALCLVDLQQDYFLGGRFPLWGARSAVRKASRTLGWARETGIPVFHMKHLSLNKDAFFLLPGTPGAEIHPDVTPRANETLVTKHYPNSFRDTSLAADLSRMAIDTVVWVGMISWMCIDTSVRASYDLGFRNILLPDATASGWLNGPYGIVTPWNSHRAFISAISKVQAEVVKTDLFLKKMSEVARK